jgi:hypothetical protein
MASLLLPPPAMARRICALLAMVVLLGLVLVLVWRIYVHHENGSRGDQPVEVSLDARAA